MGNFNPTEYKNSFNAQKYDRVNIMLPRGRKAQVEEYAKALGLSVNGLVNELLRGKLGLSVEEWKETP